MQIASTNLINLYQKVGVFSPLKTELFLIFTPLFQITGSD